MQGVFNLMIFVRLEYLRLRATRRDLKPTEVHQKLPLFTRFERSWSLQEQATT
jgi:hypothetical protein